jgi:membrane protein
VTLRSLAERARDVVRAYVAAEPFQKAAAVSYFTLLSIAPLLLIMVATTGLLFGREAVRDELVDQVQNLVGDRGARAVRTIAENIEAPGGNAVSLVVGSVVLLVGSTTAFVQLQKSLNQIMGIGPGSRRGVIWSHIRRRLISLAVVLVIGVLLTASLLADAVLITIQSQFQDLMPGAPALWQLGNTGASILIISVLVMLIYKLLSDARLPWKSLWAGGLVTASLFSGGKYLLGLYIGRAAVASAYGAAGSLVVLVIWVYYALLAFFGGATVASVSAARGGRAHAPGTAPYGRTGRSTDST